VVGDSSADPPVVAVPTVTYSIVDDSTGLFATDETIGATAIATAKAATIGSAD
jgi:hypothetical protein